MNIQGMLPSIMAPTQTPKSLVTNASTGTSGTNGSSGSSSDASSLEDTFLNLLVTELQNQDPTAPVDPTEMVTQMVSLNSLDQLISINSTLQSISGTGSTTGTPTTDLATSHGAQLATAPANPAAAPASSPASLTALNPLAAAANGVGTSGPMNLYGGVSAPAANSTSGILGAH